MLTALVATQIVDATTVATLGPYRLRRLAVDHYQLDGPDTNAPSAWVAAHLPGDRQWWTEWSGHGNVLVVDFSC